MKCAVIETGGKQYVVTPGKKLKIESVEAEPKSSVSFDKVLLRVDDAGVTIGTPYIAGARVEGMVIAQGRDDKKIVFKYHSKTRYRKKKGHRQHFTEVVIQ